MNAISPFDYSDVSANLKQELFDDAEYIRRKQADAQHNVIEAGIRLLVVKEKLPHGAFLPWVESECGISERLVQDYISIAKEFGPNPHRCADLPTKAMKVLASPSMPGDAKQEIYDKLDSGEKVTTAEIEAEKRKALEANKRADEADEKAGRAEREKSDLLTQISTISQDAETRAQAKIAEAEAKALGEIQSLKAKMDALEQDAKSNDEKIEAAVQSRAKAATDAEFAKRESELKELRKKQELTERETISLEERATRTRKNLEALLERRSRIEQSGVEAKYLEDELKKASDAINSISNDVQGLEHDHEGSVVGLAHVVADQCEGLAIMLRNLQGRNNVIEMEAVR